MTMTPRERFLASIRFEPIDRPYRLETLGYWFETLDRWHGEGLPEDVVDVASAAVYFQIDLQLPIHLGADQHPGLDPIFEEEIVEQDERCIIKRDVKGALVKVFSDYSSGIPSLVEAPVKDEASWEVMKTRLDPDTPGRLEFWEPLIELANTEPWPLCVYLCGLFGTHRHLFGFKDLMVAYRRQPQLLHAISRHWVGFWKGVVSHIRSIHRPEMVSLWEDMCYRNGPMISPDVFAEFMLPYYKELIAFLKQDLGVPVIGVDTDGKMAKLIPLFVEAGVNFIYPFEVQSEMDVIKIREEWPNQFAIWGGIDKRALIEDRGSIEAEVMRVVPPMLEKGGYIPAIDHAVPPDVPLDNWRYFLDLVRDLGERICSKA
jgi:uroporphyrinogen decarboxylase